jgi:hypothetical protein
MDQAKINAKRAVQSPRYPWLRVDMRTQREVEQSRTLWPLISIHRLARKARKLGRKLTINRDLDGAYRIGARLDGRKARTA